METTLLALRWAVGLSLAAVAASAGWSFARNREPQRARLALALGAVALVSVSRQANALTGFTSSWLADLGVVAFTLSGWALVEYRAAMTATHVLSRVAAGAGAAGTAAFALWVDVPARPFASRGDVQQLAIQLLVSVWLVSVVSSSVALWKASGGRGPVQRARLRLLAIGYADFILVVVVSFLAGAGLPIGATLTLQVFGVFAIPALWVAVWPPAWLRRRHLEAAATRQAAELGPAGSWFWDLDASDIGWTPRLHDMFATSGPVDVATVFERIHPDDRERAATAIRRCIKDREPFEIEHRVVRPDGEVRWLRARGTFVVDPATDQVTALYGSSQDITELNRRDAALRASEERYRRIVETAQEGIWIIDTDAVTTFANPALAAMLGEAVDALVGCSIFDFMAEDDADATRTSLDRRREGQEERFEIELCRRDGGTLAAAIVASPLFGDDGDYIGAMAMVADITERKEAERSLRDSFEREREAADRLRHLDQMKNAFLEAVSHELRTPLTSVMGYAQTMLRDEISGDPGRVRAFSMRIVANADRLERLLSDLLDLDRLTRGVLEPRRRPVDLGRLVEQVVDDLPAKDHPIHLEVREAVAEVSRPQIERMVESLCVNAIRHTPAGTPVWVRVEPARDHVIIVVEDAGDGVPDELKPHVFEAFQRGDGPTARAEGTGIGLALVERFAELHGGGVWVEDRPGGGARFCLRLPRRDEVGELVIGSAGAKAEVLEA